MRVCVHGGGCVPGVGNEVPWRNFGVEKKKARSSHRSSFSMERAMNALVIKDFGKYSE